MSKFSSILILFISFFGILNIEKSHAGLEDEYKKKSEEKGKYALTWDQCQFNHTEEGVYLRENNRYCIQKNGELLLWKKTLIETIVTRI